MEHFSKRCVAFLTCSLSPPSNCVIDISWSLKMNTTLGVTIGMPECHRALSPPPYVPATLDFGKGEHFAKFSVSLLWVSPSLALLPPRSPHSSRPIQVACSRVMWFTFWDFNFTWAQKNSKYLGKFFYYVYVWWLSLFARFLNTMAIVAQMDQFCGTIFAKSVTLHQKWMDDAILFSKNGTTKLVNLSDSKTALSPFFTIIHWRLIVILALTGKVAILIQI